MQEKYTVQRVEDTENGWLVTDNEINEQTLVFCNLNANTAQDAVNLLIEEIENSSVDPAAEHIESDPAE